MDIITLLLPFLSGAAGGNLLGGLLKNINLGSLGNSLAGLVGGGLGSAILGNILGIPMPTAGAELDNNAILSQVLGGAGGGGVLTMVVAYLQKWLGRAH